MWRMQKRETRPNYTVVRMETGWYHWAAVSAALATRRWMATAEVGAIMLLVDAWLCRSKSNAGKLDREEKKKEEKIASF